ncbi:hypothetical protein PILCRDRAFT_552202 [Piloderma croceum F 1598]|uniref:Uncharacterized protein n=1 Tax=Piloderma croceum (strain F 1598) TaxID=765440 RepID=A0A0C3F4S0_PILCF|nr:hypothetical protein PILCRDRAFT_552202 [Piloderma croceum F 1598]
MMIVFIYIQGGRLRRACFALFVSNVMKGIPSTTPIIGKVYASLVGFGCVMRLCRVDHEQKPRNANPVQFFLRRCTVQLARGGVNSNRIRGIQCTSPSSPVRLLMTRTSMKCWWRRWTTSRAF